MKSTLTDLPKVEAVVSATLYPADPNAVNTNLWVQVFLSTGVHQALKGEAAADFWLLWQRRS